MRKITVVLKLPRTDNGLIFGAKHIADCMDENPYFPSPPVPIATLRGQVARALDAQASTLSRHREAAPARDAELDVVRVQLESLRVYVQVLANQRPADGEALVLSAGMYVKGLTGPRKPDLRATQGLTSGTAHVYARLPRGAASFKWARSIDGETWIVVAETKRSDYLFEGLTPAIVHYFRFQVVSAEGLSDWSDPVSLLVV